MTTTTKTLTQQFAAEYAQGAVPGMLRAIRTIKRANKVILLGALAASYLHQARFLVELGAGPFAWLVPAVFDLAMVSMLTVTQTTGMHPDAKRAAMKVLVLVVLISGAVNAAAPGPIGLRVIVALVAGVEWVAGKIRPDFAAIEARENEVTAEAAVPVRKLAPEVAKARAVKAAATRKANQAARDAAVMSPAQKAAAIRRCRREAAAELAQQDELDLMLTGYTPANAPVSPAR